MTNWYNRNIVPRLIGWAMRQKPIRRVRKQLVPLASGNVLEIGFGLGANLPFYTDSIKSLVAIDVSEELYSMASEPLSAFNKPFDFVFSKAEAMPFESAQYDCVLCTWTLCSVDDPAAVAAEIRRVLKPSGRLIFAEHGLAPKGFTQTCQRLINPLYRKIAGGCSLTRSAPPLLESSGFKMDSLESDYLPGPRILTYTHRGVARLN